jgi:hypothetical protein
MYSPIKESFNVRLGNNPNKNNIIYKGRRKIKTIKEIEDFYSVEFISK